MSATLICGLLMGNTNVVAQEQAEFTSFRPKLIEAIEDQQLHIDSSQVDSIGPVLRQRIFFRNLQRSFGTEPKQQFSAYPYDKSVARAWVVDNYLIVLATGTGSAQVAVTASNNHGSMIDWFVVKVKEQVKRTEGSNPAFNSNLSQRSLANLTTRGMQLPRLDAASAIYRIVPTLPAELAFDYKNKTIHGTFDAELPPTMFYWIGITPTEDIAIQQFAFKPPTGSKSDKVNSVSAPQPLSRNLLSLLQPTSLTKSDDVSRDSIAAGASSRQGAIAASRPHVEAISNEDAYRQNVLDNIAHAMHSRSRERRTSVIEPAYTYWGYANSQYAPRLEQLIPQSVAYIGFDRRVEQHLITGLSIGLENPMDVPSTAPYQSTTNFSSILPYARWQDDNGSEIWGIFGYSRKHSQYRRMPASTSDFEQSDVFLGAVGWRQPLGSSGNILFSTVGDAGLTIPVRIQEAQEVNGIAKDRVFKRLRAGLEMTFDGQQLQPYVGLSGRINSYTSLDNAGLEALGGVRYSSFRGLTLQAEGRARASQTTLAAPELVFSAAAHVDPGLQGEGFALSVAPVYGARNQDFIFLSSTSTHYAQDQHLSHSSFDNVWTMSGTLSYGLPMAGGAITPFGQIAISTLNQTRMGIRIALNSSLDRLFDLEFTTVQSSFKQEKVDKGVDLQLRLVF